VLYLCEVIAYTPMNMKKILPFFLILSLSGNLLAQSISVKSFRKLENDLTARLDAPKKDQNGEVCAIIKVVTTQTGFIWEPDGLGIVLNENKGGEYWLYVPHGAKRLTIKHPQFGLLRDYFYTVPIEKATVYELVLVADKGVTQVEETIVSQWLAITPEPADAMVYLNDKFVKNGIYQAKLKPGTYTYRVEAPLYYMEAGKIEIKDTKIDLTVRLKPTFGYISVTSEPENDAKVIIDGKAQLNNTPCKSEPLDSGEHSVQVVKEMYQPAFQKVRVSEGQTTAAIFKLIPTFAEVTINIPAEATLFINDQAKGKGSWQGRLIAGVYSIEARQENHRTIRQDIDLAIGDKPVIKLEPTPIYGKLDVLTNPTSANIRLNGQPYGTTPNTIGKLLIGNYQLKLSKTGYATLSKPITIMEGKVTEINEKLHAGISDEDSIAKIIPVYSKEYYRYKKSKTIFLGAALASGLAGTIFYLQSSKTYKDYQTATTDAPALQDKVKLYNSIYPICFGVAGICAIEVVLKTGKQNKAKSQKISFYPVPLPGGAGTYLTYHF